MSSAVSTSITILVEYVYRRERKPESRIWHMQAYRQQSIDAVALCREFLVEDTADQVVLTISLPCDSHGNVSESDVDKHETMADELFLALRPGEILA